jgi:hypothetical protein
MGNDSNRIPAASRRRVVDVGSHEPPRVHACPACGAELDGVREADLRRVPFAWRCAPGREPTTYELRCPGCRQLIVVSRAAAGGLSVVPDQRAALAAVKQLEREEPEGRASAPGRRS